MEFLKKLFRVKDKKTAVYLLVLSASGVLLIVLSYTFGKPVDNNTSGNEPVLSYELQTAGILKEIEKSIEEKLADILSRVDGVGKVEVMITYSQGSEMIIAEDTVSDKSKTEESDSEGGTRTTSDEKLTKDTLLIRAKDGTETPIVLKELAPKISGVLIVAEGGGDIVIKDALIRSVQTVLGIEPHMVSVLKMKN